MLNVNSAKIHLNLLLIGYSQHKLNTHISLHSTTSRPMDLSAIKKNIESGVIRTTAEFQRDIMLMFQNAVMYNSSDHDVYHMALEMQRDVLEHVQQFLATQLIMQTSESAISAKSLRGREGNRKPGEPAEKVGCAKWGGWVGGGVPLKVSGCVKHIFDSQKAL